MVKYTVPLDAYVTLPRPHIRWLIEGVVPKPSLGMIVGREKSGKTFLALQIGLAIAQGTQFAGHGAYKGKVLFIQFDTSEFLWRNMLIKLAESGTDISGPIVTVHPDYIQRPFNIETQVCKQWLRDVLAEAQPDMVIIDVMRELHSKDENSSTEMKVFGDHLFPIVAPHSVILLHHSLKLDHEKHPDPRPIEAIRGSTYIGGRMDYMMLLHNDTLKVDGRMGPMTTYKTARLPSGMWSITR